MKKILIIEDDFYIRDIYTRSFTKAGYDITVAIDGEEALVKAKEGNFDMILLDIMLPKVTGIDVLKKLRDPLSPTKQTPIFLITNLGQENIIKEAFRIGADGYLLKAKLEPQDVVAEIDAFFSAQEKMEQEQTSPSK